MFLFIACNLGSGIEHSATLMSINSSCQNYQEHFILRGFEFILICLVSFRIDQDRCRITVGKGLNLSGHDNKVGPISQMKGIGDYLVRLSDLKHGARAIRLITGWYLLVASLLILCGINIGVTQNFSMISIGILLID